MTVINKRNATRRTVLKGMGVSLTLPMMESLMPRVAFAADGPANAQRLAVVTVPFGMVVEQFHPAEIGGGLQTAVDTSPDYSRPLIGSVLTA